MFKTLGSKKLKKNSIKFYEILPFLKVTKKSEIFRSKDFDVKNFQTLVDFYTLGLGAHQFWRKSSEKKYLCVREIISVDNTSGNVEILIFFSSLSSLFLLSN